MNTKKVLAGAAIAAGLLTLAPAAASATESRMAGDCYVTQGDWGMWCDNIANVPAYSQRSFNSEIRGRVQTSRSYFVCWGYGEYNGRNTVWYWAQTDDTGAYGNVSSVYVHTPQDPLPRMRQC